MEGFFSLTTLVSLLSLSFIEIVLGIDNLLFITLVTVRLPKHQQAKVRTFGLIIAMLMRLVLLAFVVWLSSLTMVLFSIAQFTFSIRDLVLIFGGLFLLFKSVQELLEHHEEHVTRHPISVSNALFQIIIFDLLFSLDSIITAVGIVQIYWVMATAIVIAVLVMLFASGPASHLVMKHPRVRVLALCILLLVGIKLIADGFGAHLSSALIFVAMGFAIFVECVNGWLKRRK